MHALLCCIQQSLWGEGGRTTDDEKAFVCSLHALSSSSSCSNMPSRGSSFFRFSPSLLQFRQYQPVQARRFRPGPAPRRAVGRAVGRSTWEDADQDDECAIFLLDRFLDLLPAAGLGQTRFTDEPGGSLSNTPTGIVTRTLTHRHPKRPPHTATQKVSHKINL